MNPQVIVVDDSLVVRMDLRGALTAAGFDVTACDTKRAAEELLEQRGFDAIVLDVMLPDGDGVEILRRVRTSARHANTPVIMLSTEADVRDRVRGLTMGADEYVGKPYNIAYFIRRLRELCTSGRASNFSPPCIVGCRRILAVDDSPTFREAITQMLRQDGHDVVLARSGREALEMLAAQTIDCIVLDLQRPEVDGIETLRKIRQTLGRETTPTLMLTDSAEVAAQRNATEAGIDEVLGKSATLDAVRATIRNLLRRKNADVSRGEVQNRSTKTNSRRTSQLESVMNAPPASRSRRDMSCGGASARPRQTFSNDFSPVFVEAVSAMGLSGQLARDVLAKALRRMSIDPQRMDHADLSRALPAIRDTLGMFFSAEEITPRVHALEALAARPH